MIPANELRIGNWVQIKEGYCKVRTIEDEEGIFAGVVSNDNVSVWDRISIAYSQPIEPIPLTPEILEKAGFEEMDNWLKLRIHSFHNFFIGYNNGVDFYLLQFGQAGIKPNIKHLHQLQNLYFALTGTELKINL